MSDTLDRQQVADRLGIPVGQVTRHAKAGRIPKPVESPRRELAWKTEDIDRFTSQLALVQTAIDELMVKAGDWSLHNAARDLARVTARLLSQPEHALEIRCRVADSVLRQWDWSTAGMSQLRAENLERTIAKRDEIAALVAAVEDSRKYGRRGHDERN